jgi:hypothetical protein
MLYNFIVLEDLAAWLNIHGLGQNGEELKFLGTRHPRLVSDYVHLLSVSRRLKV